MLTWADVLQALFFSQSKTLYDFMLIIIMLSVIMLSVIMLSVIMLSVIMLSVLMLCVIKPIVVMLDVVTPKIDSTKRKISEPESLL
jgi:hypothetical protein